MVDGSDNGNSVGDVVEMLPTAAWGQDLADALTAEHKRSGAHSSITADSLTSTGNIDTAADLKADTILEHTGNSGVTVDSMLIKDGKVQTASALSPVYTSNPYKFSAYRHAAWTTSNASFAAVVFDTESYDTGSNYNTSDGKFTAPINGFYYFHGYVRTTTSAGNANDIALYKNGSVAKYGVANKAAGAGTVALGIEVSSVLQLTAGDYVQVYHYANGQAGSVDESVYFEGHLVSAT